MFTIPFHELKQMGLKNSRKYALYQSLQEEVCQVIEEEGVTISSVKSDQLMHAIQSMALQPSEQLRLEFICPPRPPEVEAIRKWNEERLTQEVKSLRLDPLIWRAVQFKVTQYTQYNDNSIDRDAASKLSPTTPFTFESLQTITLVYQDKGGTWDSSFDPGEMMLPSAIRESTPYGLIVVKEPEGVQPVAQFMMNISPSGVISISSSTFCFLRPTKLVLSHFQFFRRKP